MTSIPSHQSSPAAWSLSNASALASFSLVAAAAALEAEGFFAGIWKRLAAAASVMRLLPRCTSPKEAAASAATPKKTRLTRRQPVAKVHNIGGMIAGASSEASEGRSQSGRKKVGTFHWVDSCHHSCIMAQPRPLPALHVRWPRSLFDQSFNSSDTPIACNTHECSADGAHANVVLNFGHPC